MATLPVAAAGCRRLVYDGLSTSRYTREDGNTLWLGPRCHNPPRGVVADEVHLRVTDSAGYSVVLREAVLPIMVLRGTALFYYDTGWGRITEEQALDTLRRAAAAADSRTAAWRSAERPARLAELYEEGPD